VLENFYTTVAPRGGVAVSWSVRAA
jgi:hypothetical protein